jgi:hypothetical protein
LEVGVSTVQRDAVMIARDVPDVHLWNKAPR